MQFSFKFKASYFFGTIICFSWHHRCVTHFSDIPLLNFYRRENEKRSCRRENLRVISASLFLCVENYRNHLALQKTKSVNCNPKTKAMANRRSFLNKIGLLSGAAIAANMFQPAWSRNLKGALKDAEGIA